MLTIKNVAYKRVNLCAQTARFVTLPKNDFNDSYNLSGRNVALTVDGIWFRIQGWQGRNLAGLWYDLNLHEDEHGVVYGYLRIV